MKKYTTDELSEAWGIFMGLCEEFPELYDKYVEKIEKEMEEYRSEVMITDEQKRRAIDKVFQRIKNEN